MKLDILNIKGSSTGKSADLPDEIFGLEPNTHAMYLAVKQYNANQRQGTHKAKERGEIAGSTRKVKKQKGTGTARMGSIKSGTLRGGGRMFGPKPRNYSFKLNKKVKSLARISALSTKVINGQLKVVEDFTFDSPKTKEFKNVLASLDATNVKTLLVTGDYDMNLYHSSRNVPKSSVMNVKDLNTYSLLNAQSVILSESAVDYIKEKFA